MAEVENRSPYSDARIPLKLSVGPYSVDCHALISGRSAPSLLSSRIFMELKKKTDTLETRQTQQKCDHWMYRVTGAEYEVLLKASIGTTLVDFPVWFVVVEVAVSIYWAGILITKV